MSELIKLSETILLNRMYDTSKTQMITTEISSFINALSPEEHAKIRPVLERDLEFQRREQARIRTLRTSIDMAKSLSNNSDMGSDRTRSGSTDSFSSQNSNTASNNSSVSPNGPRKQCKTCGDQLGFIFKAGAKCRKCQGMVCERCQCWINRQQKYWLCAICFQERELQAASNQWFYNASTDPTNISEILLLQMRRATLHRLAESSNNMDIAKRPFNYNPRRNMSLPPIASENLLQVPSERITEHPMRALHRFLQNTNSSNNNYQDSIEEIDSETESLSSLPSAPTINAPGGGSPSGRRFLEVKAKYPHLRPRSPTRTVRSNSLNVPDGAVALSIQIPGKEMLRTSSICSCSRCSWTSETERPRSGMTESTVYSDIDSMSPFPHSRPQSECNLSIYTASPATAKRSASADYFQRPENASIPHSPTPPSEGQSRNGSRTSVSTRPSVDNTVGQIQIKLHYNLEMGSLDVGVLECKDLPHFGKHNPNPTVYISLLPDDGYLEHSRVKTKCKKNSHSPVFSEILKFSNLTKFELDDRTLHFQVFHIDPFSKKSLIGESHLKVEDYPWSEEEPIWLPLKKELTISITPPEPPKEITSRRGLLRFEMSFKVKDPKKQRGDIVFLAKSGLNLCGDPNILAKMPFVKANLLSNRKIIASARSSLAEFKGNGREPIWNYKIVIQDQSLEKLKKRALEASVWDRETSSNNRYIGRLLFYLSDPSKQEKTTQSMWRKLIENPGVKFDAELQLQP